MRRFQALLGVLLLAGTVGSAAAKPPGPGAVLAIVEAYDGSRLVWLKPRDLRRLPGSVSLPGGACCAVVSPSGSYVALGGPSGAGVRIVDLVDMKVVATIAKRRWSTDRRLSPVAWTRWRLLVLDSPGKAGKAPARLLSIDPVARRVLWQAPAEGWVAWAVAGRQLVVLSEPRSGVVRLSVLGPDGTVLRGADIGTGFPAGSPALALDPVGRRAFVAGFETLAQVDLQTLDRSYTSLSPSRPLASRPLAPAARAKEAYGWTRQATWLGGGMLAVSGSTYERGRTTPAGLALVDTETGNVRVLEPRASAHRLARGMVLAFGAARDAQTNQETGMGLAAFRPDGTKAWSALGSEAVWWIAAAGAYGYLPAPEWGYPPRLRVVDLATGAVVNTIRSELPEFAARG